MHGEHDTQERSDLEADRVRDNRRRAGDDIPETPRQTAFVWVDLIRTIADQTGGNTEHMIMERLADIIGANPQVKSTFRQQNQEMSNAIEKRSALRDHRG
ncbi:MAG TPA: hypothetical protein VK972_09375 [Wenzhouxiangella sp.]|nr:hypothetical protein [Wenzhouxiangella sp.]